MSEHDDGAWPGFPGHQRTADDLRAAAVELRDHIAAVVDGMGALGSFDRPDVWQGAVADRHRLIRAEALRRLSSPIAGALSAMVDIVLRFEARAAALDAPEPLAPACTFVEQMLDRWSLAPPCGE